MKRDDDEPIKVTVKVPASVGAAVDFLYATREARKKLERDAKEVKAKETAIETEIFAKFKKGDLEGARGKTAQASISSTDVPTLEDDEAFFTHLRKHPEDLDLLQRRLAVEAARARWAENKTIPGVGTFTAIKLHLTKVKPSTKIKAPVKGKR